MTNNGWGKKLMGGVAALAILSACAPPTPAVSPAAPAATALASLAQNTQATLLPGDVLDVSSEDVIYVNETPVANRVVLSVPTRTPTPTATNTPTPTPTATGTPTPTPTRTPTPSPTPRILATIWLNYPTPVYAPARIVEVFIWRAGIPAPDVPFQLERCVAAESPCTRWELIATQQTDEFGVFWAIGEWYYWYRVNVEGVQIEFFVDPELGAYVPVGVWLP